ncbi:hypothetical protein P154DRAFT_517991 [Amniculicola lignicola CBS 123094]|uniref:Uncharacterized protein n=1 Tax=Amniculicola lignicola CBS 123094 TaxID=1392246 RepID=A0A6A5WXP9_9PLEO|nr:hypothetical protein P154DRAFT_517991 [Amniculicola lignicola CBS 123094]
MFYGEYVYNCNITDGTLRFTYSRPGNVFQLNQTWTKHGQKYWATGTGSTTLSCATKFWNNTQWTIGQDYSKTFIYCSPMQFEMDAKVKKLGRKGRWSWIHL